MERIDPKSAVILVDRPRRKIQAQLAGAGFTFVENWTAKKAVTLDVERDFRQPLSGFDKSVKLKTAVSRQGVERTCLRDGHDVVRLRIDPEFRREKVLQQKDIAQFGHFDGRLQSRL